MLRHLALIIACVAALSAAAYNSADYLRHIDRAATAIDAGEWRRAESEFEAARALEPGNPANIMLLANIGMLRFYDGRDDEAIDALTSAHEMAPVSVTILLNRAEVYKTIGNVGAALADYTRVCELDSTVTEAFLNRGILLLQMGEYDAARDALEVPARLEPDSHTAHLALATIAWHDRRWSDTAAHLTHVLAAAPEARYYAWRARALLLSDDLPGAADDIAAGLALNPDEASLYTARALLNKLRYRPDDARADADRAIALGESPDFVNTLLDAPSQ